MFIKKTLTIITSFFAVLSSCCESDSKPSSNLFLKIEADTDLVKEGETFKVRIFYGHDFYNDKGYLNSPSTDNQPYYLNLISNENTIFSNKLEDFLDEKYDCLINQKVDYKDNFVNQDISWEELNNKNENIIRYEAQLSRPFERVPECEALFHFVRESNDFKFKIGYFDN